MSRPWRLLLAVLLIALLSANGTQGQPLQPPGALRPRASAYTSSDFTVLFSEEGPRSLLEVQGEQSEPRRGINYGAPTGVVASASTPLTATLTIGQQITVTINIDMSGVSPSDNYLGSFTGRLDWNTAVLSYTTNSGIRAGFTGVVNATSAGTESAAASALQTLPTMVAIFRM